MPGWLQDHNIHENLKELHKACASANQRADEEEDSATSTVVARFRRVVEATRAALERSDEDLVPRSVVDAMAEATRDATSELNQYAGDGNAGRIETARNHVDSILRSRASLPVLHGQDPEITLRSLEALTERIGELDDLVNRRMAAGDTSIKEQADLVTELRKDTEDLRSQVSTASKEFKSHVDSVHSRIDEQIEGLAGRFDATIAELEVDAESRIKAKERRFDEALSEKERDASASLESLASELERAEKIVGVIAGTGMSGGYQQDADAEEEKANKWRRYTIVFGLVAVGFIGLVLLVRGRAESALELATRVVVSLGFGGLAAYAGSQAAAHRQRSRRSRTLQLSLLSLRPYLEDVEPEAKAEVLRAFAFVFFTPPDGDDAESELASPSVVNQLLNGLARQVTNGET